MGLTRAAIIVIVLVGCLGVTALGAALFRHYNPLGDDPRNYNSTYEQSQYMRSVRMRNYGHLKRESLGAARDLESRYQMEETTSNLSYHPYPQEPPTPSTNH